MAHEVLIALTPDLTSHLARLAESSDVWLVRTAQTERAAERVRAGLPAGDQAGREGRITLFNGSDRPEADLVSLIDEVELHHGLATDREEPVTVIRVIGADPTASVRSALAAYNFTDIASKPNGFVARWVQPEG